MAPAQIKAVDKCGEDLSYKCTEYTYIGHKHFSTYEITSMYTPFTLHPHTHTMFTIGVTISPSQQQRSQLSQEPIFDDNIYACLRNVSSTLFCDYSMSPHECTVFTRGCRLPIVH